MKKKKGQWPKQGIPCWNMAKARCRVEPRPLRPNRATRWVEIGRHPLLAVFSDAILCRGHSARQGHLVWPPRHLVSWPPPVRLFAQPTDACEASRQHPAGDVDAYSHTHAHADALWGPQYEMLYPHPGYSGRVVQILPKLRVRV